MEALVETLSFRQIGVVNEEYAVSADGMKMFGVLDLETQMECCRFAIGIRNSHDKSLRLGLLLRPTSIRVLEYGFLRRFSTRSGNVHRLYFEPEHPEFAARTMCSLSNAFTSAFKKLDPIPQFKATAEPGEFLSSLPAD